MRNITLDVYPHVYSRDLPVNRDNLLISCTHSNLTKNARGGVQLMVRLSLHEHGGDLGPNRIREELPVLASCAKRVYMVHES